MSTRFSKTQQIIVGVVSGGAATLITLPLILLGLLAAGRALGRVQSWWMTGVWTRDPLRDFLRGWGWSLPTSDAAVGQNIIDQFMGMDVTAASFLAAVVVWLAFEQIGRLLRAMAPKP